jgi:hypothetical protein
MEYPTNEATDRIDLGICDYMSKEETKTNNSSCPFISKSVISYNTTVIKSGGDSQIFIGNFFDNKGNKISDIVPKWEIVCDFINVLEIEKSDNQISIGINDDDYIDEEFKLILSDAEGNYSSSMFVQIESLL